MVVKRCSCGEYLSRNNKSGKCLSCAHKGRQMHRFQLGRTCRKCGDPITDNNQSGLCKKHHNREEAKKPRHESDGGRLRLVKCHMPGCDITFYVEWWQHPEMAYCRKCRQSEEYRESGDWLDYESGRRKTEPILMGGL